MISLTEFAFVESYEKLCRIFGKKVNQEQCKEWFRMLPKRIDQRDLNRAIVDIGDDLDRFPSFSILLSRVISAKGVKDEETPKVYFCRAQKVSSDINTKQVYTKYCNAGILAVEERPYLVGEPQYITKVYRCPICNASNDHSLKIYEGTWNTGELYGLDELQIIIEEFKENNARKGNPYEIIVPKSVLGENGGGMS